MKRVTFQTRARTIDHLGRGQIADCPTAVSELWKNAYDAYARNVELQIFDGEIITGAIFDDGFGMAREDFLSRWLVIGTESKIDAAKTTPVERFGIPERPRQGEKGIGRLSAAFLAPVNLIVSKKLGKPFAAALVDWRLFENPFLSLDDIGIPVEEFEKPEQLFELLPKMMGVIKENLSGENGPGDRRERLHEGWARYDDYEKSQKTTSRLPVNHLSIARETPVIHHPISSQLLLNQPSTNHQPPVNRLSNPQFLVTTAFFGKKNCQKRSAGSAGIKRTYELRNSTFTVCNCRLHNLETVADLLRKNIKPKQ